MILAAPTRILADNQAALDEAVAAMRGASLVAVDTEADSRHHYPEKVCLIQLSDGERAFLVDALAGLDYAGLGEILEAPHIEKALHGADFDIRGLNRDYGFALAPCYDTSIAARFAGLERTGLVALLNDLLGVTIPKDRRLQRADWSRRPLSDEALNYAASDVVHLGALRRALHKRLQTLGRDAWVAEEFDRLAAIRYVPPDLSTAHLLVKGSRGLDARGLAVLKALCAFRESEARRLDRPPGYVLPAQALIYLAAHPNASFSETPHFGPALARRYGGGIRKALREGVDAPPYQRPRSPNPPPWKASPADAARLSMLKAWRAELGAKLSLDPALLWPMRSLERLARAPASFEEEQTSPDVRRWQRREFGESLRSALETGAGAASPDKSARTFLLD